MSEPRLAQDLIELFAILFRDDERTILVRGDGEPVYLPYGTKGEPAQVVFAHGYFASALHEISHWCIAGRARRELQDYGYWYKPEGRNAADQKLFEGAEAKPQALEWIFSVAAGAPFHVSADALADGGSETAEARASFERCVHAQVATFLERDLPPRALRFASALAERYGTGDHWRAPASYKPFSS